MIQKKFLIDIFIMLQKNSFGQFFFSNFMHGFKSATCGAPSTKKKETFERYVGLHILKTENEFQT